MWSIWRFRLVIVTGVVPLAHADATSVRVVLDARPRFECRYCVLRHLVDLPLLVVLARERQVHAYPRANLRWTEVDDLLRIGLVPDVYVYHPQRMARIDGSPRAALRRQSGKKNECKEDTKHRKSRSVMRLWSIHEHAYCRRDEAAYVVLQRCCMDRHDTENDRN